MNDSTQYVITVDTCAIQRDSIKFTKTDTIAGSIATSLWLFGLVVTIMILTMKSK